MLGEGKGEERETECMQKTLHTMPNLYQQHPTLKGKGLPPPLSFPPADDKAMKQVCAYNSSTQPQFKPLVQDHMNPENWLDKPHLTMDVLYKLSVVREKKYLYKQV